jgi:hypothetical protein
MRCSLRLTHLPKSSSRRSCGVGELPQRLAPCCLYIPRVVLPSKCPLELVHYFNYVRGLSFKDKPDYYFLRGLLNVSLTRLKGQSLLSVGYNQGVNSQIFQNLTQQAAKKTISFELPTSHIKQRKRRPAKDKSNQSSPSEFSRSNASINSLGLLSLSKLEFTSSKGGVVDGLVCPGQLENTLSRTTRIASQDLSCKANSMRARSDRCKSSRRKADSKASQISRLETIRLPDSEVKFKPSSSQSKSPISQTYERGYTTTARYPVLSKKAKAKITELRARRAVETSQCCVL